MRKNSNTNGTKFKVDDLILCVKDPEGNPNPNIRAGDVGIVIKNPRPVKKEGENTSDLVFKIKNKGRTYCYWAEDDDCYVKMEEDADLRTTLEQEILKLNSQRHG
jgi:hypothetical protein